MKKLTRLTALLLAILMVVFAGATYATATDLEENEEEGVAGNWDDPDTERTQAESVNIKKEIIAFNPNGTTVHAPVVTYTYTVTPATVASDTTITDEAGDHEANAAVTASVNAGITTGLIVTGTAAGTAGDANSATGTLEFTNASTFTTAAAGDTNEYDINLDFSNVDFTQPGVYRYQIAETISADSYDVIAMEDGEGNTLFLDVYVDGSGNIYGYVCMTANGSVTPDTTTKINGFVDGTAADNSDKYYTYDLTLSKDVENDSYAEANTAFPFTVIFNNSESYTSTFTIGQTVGDGSTGLNSSATTLSGLPAAWNGVALVKDGGDITLTGIPAGVDADVYETNIVTGVTYTVETSVNGGEAVTDNNVIAGSAPTEAVAQTTKKDYESTKATVDTPKIEKVSEEQTVEITNTLSLISPTGLVVRFAPYGLLLIGGIALLIIAMKHRKHNEED